MAQQVVTVFGGSGFLGRYVVRALAPTGAAIRIACRRQREAMICKSMGDVGQIAPVPCNIRDDASVAAAVAGANTVINLTGILYERGAQTFDAVHREGAARIAAAAGQAGVERLIHVSAIGADLGSDSAYARSKAAGEEAVREAFPGATIMRPGLVFGAEDEFFNRFAMYARLAPVLPLIGGGHTKFQPVYVCDVAQAIVRALADNGTRNEIFELGGPRVTTFRELMELLLSTIHRRRLLIPVPFWAATAKAALIEAGLALPAAVVPGLTPPPPLTVDQVRLLRRDNIVGGEAGTLADLDIVPVSMEAILPSYLCRFRPGGGLRDDAARAAAR